jgi:hypothetical protein
MIPLLSTTQGPHGPTETDAAGGIVGGAEPMQRHHGGQRRTVVLDQDQGEAIVEAPAPITAIDCSNQERLRSVEVQRGSCSDKGIVG